MNRVPPNRGTFSKAPSDRPAFSKAPSDRPALAKPASHRQPFVPPKPNARAVALNTLQDVTQSAAFASLALDKRLRDSSLSQLDRAFVTQLVYGVIEEQRLLDYRVDKYLHEPEHVSPLARDLLRLGAYQILFLDRVPDHAACDETVSLAKQFTAALPFAGMINFALRRLSEGKNAPVEWPPDPMDAFALKTSWPRWILERLTDAYGTDEAERIAMLRAFDTGVTIRINTLKMDAESFEKRMEARGWTLRKGLLPGSYYTTSAGSIGDDPDFRAGLFSVEGAASMLAAETVGAKRGMRILDACAAPGGKTAYMAERMGQSGRVFALDKYPHRVELIRAQAGRLGLENIKPIERDATRVNSDWIDYFDAVLVDAPCSGLGVAADKPDIRGRLTPESLAELVAVQRDILETCAAYVKPGGAMVYATCSILPEENARQIESFLKFHKDYSIDRTPIAHFTPDEFGLQLQPRFEAGENPATPVWIEGFFVARLIRSRGGVRA
ncbi:MAG: 16S rRNA (cytosine(967)-C(5))-methyltransferase RsmB [Oscillospiraceae bacterium]|jgi:16S rRNA (cytosine967-C5)-methyltransferase|nr:16S rRNA (cytosine(967)-C(5))-methyltransferase RsmB [Oscillospiraceae bacterium]